MKHCVFLLIMKMLCLMLYCLIILGILKELKIQNIRNKFEAEEQAAHQNFEVGKIFTVSVLPLRTLDIILN